MNLLLAILRLVVALWSGYTTPLCPVAVHASGSRRTVARVEASRVRQQHRGRLTIPIWYHPEDPCGEPSGELRFWRRRPPTGWQGSRQ